jgi:hypothetical protein
MIGVSADKIEKHGENAERARFQLPIPTQLLRQQLDKAISDLLNEKRKEKIDDWSSLLSDWSSLSTTSIAVRQTRPTSCWKESRSTST